MKNMVVDFINIKIKISSYYIMAEIQIENTPWQIFDKPHFVDNSTTQYEYVEYKERNVNVTGISEYNLINQDLDVPLMIPDSFIQVKCVIKRADNGNDINTGK